MSCVAWETVTVPTSISASAPTAPAPRPRYYDMCIYIYTLYVSLLVSLLHHICCVYTYVTDVQYQYTFHTIHMICVCGCVFSLLLALNPFTGLYTQTLILVNVILVELFSWMVTGCCSGRRSDNLQCLLNYFYFSSTFLRLPAPVMKVLDDSFLPRCVQEKLKTNQRVSNA